MLSKEFKNEVKRIKELAKKVNTVQEVHNALDIIYNRISNVKGKDSEYDIIDIFKCKTIKEYKIKKEKNKSVIFEFVNYPKVADCFLFIYNEFEGHSQKHIDIYIKKD